MCQDYRGCEGKNQEKYTVDERKKRFYWVE